MSIHERLTGARTVIIRGRYFVVTLTRTDSGSWDHNFGIKRLPDGQFQLAVYFSDVERL